MIRCIHIADLHLGLTLYGSIDQDAKLNDRTLEGFELLDFTIDKASNEADILFIAGDIYESQNPSNRVRIEFEKRIVHCNTIGLPVVYIPGNHCTPKSEGSCHPFVSDRVLSLPNVFLIDSLGVQTVTAKNGEPIDVLGLPHLFPKDWRKYGETSGAAVSKVIKKAKVGKNASVVLGHLMIAGVKNTYQGRTLFSDEFLVPKEVFQATDKFGAFMLGHIHQHQKIDDRIWYSGSLFPNDFGEEGEKKGYVAFSIDNENELHDWRFEEFPSYTQFRTVDIVVDDEDKDPTAVILRSIVNSDVKGCIARVVYHVTEEQLLKVDQVKIREELSSAKYFDLAYEITEADRKDRENSIGGELKPSEAVKEYCSLRGGEFEGHSDELIEVTEGFLDELDREREAVIRSLD